MRTLKIVGIVVAALFSIIVVIGVGLRLYLTDARLTAMTEQALNNHFAGHFSVGKVQWRLPLHLDIKDVEVRSPGGLPVVKLAGLSATIRASALLRATVAVTDVTIDGVKVDLGIPKRGALPLAKALEPTQPEPEKAPRDKAVPLRIEFSNVALLHSQAEMRHGDTRVHVQDIHLNDGFIWLGGDRVGASAAMTCNVQLDADPVKMPLPGLQIAADNLVYRFATDVPEASAQAITVTTPGIDLRASGKVRLGEAGIVDANTRVTLAVDTENATLRHNLPGDVYRHLRGAASLETQVMAHDEAVHVVTDLRESRFEIYGEPVKLLHADLTWADQRLTIRDARLGVRLGEVTLNGNMQIATSGDAVTVGGHQLNLKTRSFPLRPLAGQFVKAPELLPETLSIALTSQGRSLLPPTSELLVDVVPDGLPGSNWPGLPTSMELRGRFLTHPDLLEVLKLEVNVEHIPSFAIQGALPMRSQSVFDIIQEIHAAHPKGPLRRIPAAPATTDAG